MTPRERLIALRDQLRSLPTALPNYEGPLFSLDTWYSTYDPKHGVHVDVPDNSLTDKKVDTIVEGSCGTSACAFGWATLNPALRAEGLGVKLDTPHFDGTYGFEAATKFFDTALLASEGDKSLHSYEARYRITFFLFDPAYYGIQPYDPNLKDHDSDTISTATPAEVADRIDLVLDGKLTMDMIVEAQQAHSDAYLIWREAYRNDCQEYEDD